MKGYEQVLSSVWQAQFRALIDFSAASSTVLSHLLLLGCVANQGLKKQKLASSGSPAVRTRDSHLSQ